MTINNDRYTVVFAFAFLLHILLWFISRFDPIVCFDTNTTPFFKLKSIFFKSFKTVNLLEGNKSYFSGNKQFFSNLMPNFSGLWTAPSVQ